MESLSKQKVSTQTLGKQGELLAEQYLAQKGFTLIERNFNSRFGEIDLIMLDKDCLVFVEVRQRKNTLYGSPLETISAAKQKKLRRTAQCYCQLKAIPSRQALRFDVVGIISGKQQNSIEWVPNAF